MRLNRVLQLLFLPLLLLALFGGEVCESACFVDDISNDYIEAPASPVLQSAKMTNAYVISQGKINVADELILHFAAVSSIGLSRSLASDLLSLLSIQRK